MQSPNRQTFSTTSISPKTKINTQFSTRYTVNTQKTSVKKLLDLRQNKSSSKKQILLNLTYQDIRIKKKQQLKLQLQSFLCYKSVIMQQKLCVCSNGSECMWVNKWLKMFPISKKVKIATIPKNNLNQIQKDLKRTTFKNGKISQLKFLMVLKQTLISYCHSDPQVNYVQGFNHLVAAIVTHTDNYQHAYQIFQSLMHKKKLRNLYLEDFKLAKLHSHRISQLLRVKSWNLYLHLLQLDIEFQMFILGWIIPLFSNIVSINNMHLVIDQLFIRGQFFIYSFSLTLILYFRQEILQMTETTDVLQLLSVGNIIGRNIEWEELIEASQNFPLSHKDIFQSANLMQAKQL